MLDARRSSALRRSAAATTNDKGGNEIVTYTLQFDPTGVNADIAIIHDNETFHVQWKAVNLGPDDTPAFIDRLRILQVPSCPGDDSEDNPVVYDSSTDGDPADFSEPVIAAGAPGPLMSPQVGPFTAGSYRLSVTLDDGGQSPVTSFNCIEIAASDSAGADAQQAAAQEVG
jgi:hypothetical protein